MTMPTDVPSIIDSHVHFWDLDAHQWYPQLHGWAEYLGRPGHFRNHLPADYAQAQDAYDVAGLVHVSATTAPHAYLDEAAWLEPVLASFPGHAVMLGTVDPELSSAEIVEHLDRQGASARFRGLRVFEGLQCGSEAARTILAWLDEREAVFDLVTGAQDFAAWADFLAGYPRVRVVLEHLGSPAGADDLAPWTEAMHRAADTTDWVCKFSGLGMILPDLTVASVEPWLDAAVDAWGWERLAYGSNMPIDTLADSHARLAATVRELVAAKADPGQARAFFHDTANTAYAVTSIPAG